ncbi:lysM domain receptor-like kinase 4 [Panicum miliaceum]|uniref:LysM domain receptor-like kinase 4 n=1 Tax=Panicum miliaceum TaxID=4540 RepID=A0A3L6PJ55_PANMI|nr:lysM domain receptor-like kinase 4 [Panicum miliaceum]
MASFRALTASSSLFLVLLFLASGELAPLQLRVRAQQPYGSAISDCPNQHNASGLLGYFCGAGSAPSCPAFLTFNARPPYSSLASIAALLGADAAGLAAANGVAAAGAPLVDGTRVLVPATCACTATPEGRFYQRNATYVVKPGDTLLIIAKDTFQGLSSCQALQAQGLRGAAPETLNASQTLPVPLRCACPSAAQAAAGARFLVSYLVVEFDDVSAVAARFGVDVETIKDANRLEPPYTILPNTTLLVPVSAQPNVSRIQTPPSPPPPPPVVAPLPAKKSSSHVGVYIGVAVAVLAVAAIASAGAVLALKARRRRAGAALATGELAKKDGKGKGNDTNTTSSGFTGGGEFSLSTSEAFSSLSVTDIKSSLKVYTYAELRAATDDFSPDRHIGGSVYRAAFNGDAAAVEVVDRNVSTEVEIMRKINHLNLIRLIGLCHHHGRWYLVTEYAEHGALRDRLLAAGAGAAAPLTWAQRVQVALDVAEGLRYLHEYARPPCVHMDVSSGSVLLAGDGPRAKLRSFGAARAITGAEEALFTMTSSIAGTRGYIAPEYLEHGVVSPRADVYSLGVVLLELVTGKDAEELVGDGVGDPFAALRELAEELDGGGDAVLQRLEELVDPALPAGSCPQDAVVMMVRLVERCVRRDAAARPSTGEVARRLLNLSGVSAVSWRNSPESPRSSGSGKGLMY